MRHPRDRANATGDARIVSRGFSNPLAGCSKSNLTFQGVEREPDACFNSLYTSGECCLGTCRAPRGRCIGGVCECHASFAGFDCSDHPADGHPAGFIYVHSPPPKLGLHNALRFQCHRNTYDSDWHFLRRLLAAPLARGPARAGGPGGAGEGGGGWGAGGGAGGGGGGGGRGRARGGGGGGRPGRAGA